MGAPLRRPLAIHPKGCGLEFVRPRSFHSLKGLGLPGLGLGHPEAVPGQMSQGLLATESPSNFPRHNYNCLVERFPSQNFLGSQSPHPFGVYGKQARVGYTEEHGDH